MYQKKKVIQNNLYFKTTSFIKIVNISKDKCNKKIKISYV